MMMTGVRSRDLKEIDINDVEACQKWLSENLERLKNAWLREPEIVKFAPDGCSFQIFRRPIFSTPFAVSEAVDSLKTDLICHAVLGKKSELVVPGSGERLFSFAGFIEQTGRLPKDNEYVTFVARQWFQLCEIRSFDPVKNSVRVTPAVGCECYVKVVSL